MQNNPLGVQLQALQQGRITQLAISDSGFVFDPTTGQSFTVNSTGLLLLQYVKQQSSVTHILEQLVTEYQLTVQSANHALSTFVHQLQRYFA